MILQKLEKAGAIRPPKWLTSNVRFLAMMGSTAYGVAGATSDVDLVGFCIPPKELVFPSQFAGEIPGFGRQLQRFEVWTESHIKSPDGKKAEYDATVFGIVKFFQMLMEGNPNITDTVYCPRNCVLVSSPISEHIRQNRKTFLSKAAFFKYKGFSYSNFHKYKPDKKETMRAVLDFQREHNVSNQDIQQALRLEGIKRSGIANEDVVSQTITTGLEHLNEHDFAEYARLIGVLGSRDITTLENGLDRKAIYHTVRLLGSIEQILIEHDLDIQRNREQLKAIRRGDWTFEQAEAYFNEKEKSLEMLYATSSLPHSPDEEKIKQILMDVLEMEYGSLDAVVAKNPSMEALIGDLQAVLARYDAT